MKIRFVILSLTFVAFAAGLTDEEKKIVANNKECLKDVDETVVKDLRQGDYSNGDEQHQRLVFCIFTKNNLISPDGKFKKDYALSLIPKDDNWEKAEAAVTACMKENGATPQESVWKMAKCYNEKNPGHMYL